MFDNEQVKIVFLREIVKDQRKVMGELLDFIGVDDVDFYPEKGVFRNGRKTIRFKKLWVFLKHSWLWSFVERNAPTKVLGFLDMLVMKIMFKPGRRKNLSREDKNILKKKYRGGVVELNKYLNKERLIDFDLLEYWGYE